MDDSPVMSVPFGLYCRIAMLLPATLLLHAGAHTGRFAIPTPTDTLWLIGPTPSSDAVHRTDSEASLRARFGAQQVRRARIEVGEGETVPGVILFPDDSTRRLAVEWRDSLARRTPARVTVKGAGSRWMVFPGVHIGTSMRELERLNGGPFALTGFGWDYGGMVTSWRKGRLERVWQAARGPSATRIRFDAQPTKGVSLDAVSGEDERRSDHPVMRRLDPRIVEISVAPR